MRRGLHLAFVLDALRDGPVPEAEIVTRLGQTISAPYALRRWQQRTWHMRRRRVELDYPPNAIVPPDERRAIRSARREVASNHLANCRRNGHIERIHNNGMTYLQLRVAP